MPAAAANTSCCCGVRIETSPPDPQRGWWARHHNGATLVDDGAKTPLLWEDSLSPGAPSPHCTVALPRIPSLVLVADCAASQSALRVDGGAAAFRLSEDGGEGERNEEIGQPDLPQNLVC